MARLFDDAQSEYLKRNDICGITDMPITFSCFFKSDAAINQTLMAMGDTDLGRAFIMRLRDPADSDVLALVLAAEGVSLAASSAQWSINTWHHATCVFAGPTSRAVYLDGANKGINSTNRTYPATMDNTTIGCEIRSSNPDIFAFSGLIAEAGIWIAELSDEEIAALGAGFSPLFIRPASLIAYWPLKTNADIELINAYEMTPYNTPTWGDHCRILLPSTSIGGSFFGVPITPMSAVKSCLSKLSGDVRIGSSFLSKQSCLSKLSGKVSIGAKFSGEATVIGSLEGAVYGHN